MIIQQFHRMRIRRGFWAGGVHDISRKGGFVEGLRQLRKLWKSLRGCRQQGRSWPVQLIPACATGDVADAPGQSYICWKWEAMHHEPTSPEVRGPDAVIPVINIADPDSEASGR